MNLNDITDQFKDRLKVAWEKVQESTAYQQAMEKYQDLPGQQQRLIRYGGGILFVLFLISPPISTLLSSQEAINDFERKREVTRELLKVVRDSSNAPNIPQAPDLFSLQSRFQQDLQNDKLLPEQIYSIQAATDSGIIIPKKFSVGALNVNLKDLNLRQILEIAFRLSSVSPTVKMTDLELIASNDKPGYFHMNSKVVALKTPPPPVIEPDNSKDKKGAPSRPSNKVQPEDDTEGAPPPPSTDEGE